MAELQRLRAEVQVYRQTQDAPKQAAGDKNKRMVNKAEGTKAAAKSSGGKGSKKTANQAAMPVPKTPGTKVDESTKAAASSKSSKPAARPSSSKKAANDPSAAVTQPKTPETTRKVAGGKPAQRNGQTPPPKPGALHQPKAGAAAIGRPGKA
eukprot:2405127-Rhodomonas_salina.2